MNDGDNPLQSDSLPEVKPTSSGDTNGLPEFNAVTQTSDSQSNVAHRLEPSDPISEPIGLFSAGWQAALMRHPKISIQQSLKLCTPTVQVTSESLAAPKLQVTSFRFTPQISSLPMIAKPARSNHQHASNNKIDINQTVSPPSTKTTRIKPPKDVVTLKDRLFFLLQPPLETFLNTDELTLKFKPFPYQLDGISFLYPRHAAVLADEMGLGKTMQAVTSIRLLLHHGEAKSILLICPKPLVTNWKREFDLWAPELPILTIEGDTAKRHWQWSQPAPVKLANYEVVLRDQESLIDSTRPYDLVVLDEAQRIKNRSSSTSKVIGSIPRTRSWALTGTPVENSHEDLVGIFDFLAKGLIHSAMRPKQMAREVADYILRRTKDGVLDDMPPKLVRDECIELSDAQRSAYERAENDGVIKLNQLDDQITIQHVFELVLRLKQICNFDPATGESSKLDRLQAELAEVAASKQKAIIFSQWVDTIDQIKPHLAEFHPLEYHGRIPSKKRDQILTQFKEDEKSRVILMSYGAGSVGLNLQFCRYVFLFDRWWNPAVEDQAINRAHRLGSTGSVTVTRYTSASTIEERIHLILEEKRELFESLINENQAPKRALSHDEIFGLFQLKNHGRKQRRAA
jgi:SNF2 family DNA or RNA helicase